nr:glycosyltransferase [Chitinophagaceae bacterium]
MPVYNEQDSILIVLMEWRKKLDDLGLDYTLCVLNDGSKDNTLNILQGFSNVYPQLKIVNKENSGHGQTCVYGYK